MPSPAPALLALLLLQGAPAREPLTMTACQDVQYVELSRMSIVVGQHICVSPGLMTSVLFDASVAMDLQDEVRFTEVTRGQRSVSFIPPRDMAPGERLRLTFHFADGSPQESVTFVLEAHSGQATRQVEVYRDQRTCESFQYELAHERARSQQLREELERMRERFNRLGELRGPILSGVMGTRGIQREDFPVALLGHSENGLKVEGGATYRCDKRVAIEVWLVNSSAEPWTLAGASLTSEGRPIKEILWDTETIPPGASQPLVVEVAAKSTELQGEVTLSLWESGQRSINIPRVFFPQLSPAP